MNEQSLRSFLTRLGIKVERSASKNSKPGKVWLDFCCPHAPYHPSHDYSAERGASAGAVADTTGKASRYSCHSCKSHGTVFDLVRFLQAHQRNPRVDYDALAEEAIQAESEGLAGVVWGQDIGGFDPPPEPLIEEAYEGLWPAVYEHPEGRAYVVNRGLSEEACVLMGLLFDPQKHRVMFPVRERTGALFGWSGRSTINAKPKVLDYEGLPKRWLILGEHRWRGDMPKIIVEGLFAYARLIQEGVEEIADIGALLGSELTPEKAAIIRSWGNPTYMLVDADAAGDACLFGPVKEVIPYQPTGDEDEDSEVADTVVRDEEKGAIKLLHEYVPLFLPAFPEGKTDPDDLVFEEIEVILEETVRWGLENTS